MKKKLISYDAFNKIQESSLSVAEFELVEAADLLAKTLNLETLDLESFSQNTVIFETLDGTFVHANYELGKSTLTFENIQELEIDEESQRQEKRKLLTNMVDFILEGNEEKAKETFSSYLNSPIFKQEVTEAAKVTVSKPTGKRSKLFHKKQSRSLVAKRIRAMKKTKLKLRMNPSLKKATERKKKAVGAKISGSSNPRARTYARYMKAQCVKEWAGMVDNIYDFLDFQDFGPALKNSIVECDEHGNVEKVVIPTTSKRDEGRILNFDWMNIDSEVKVLRGKAKFLSEDSNFCKAVNDLKRYNAISDDSALEECLENIAAKWPVAIYLTEAELSQVIKVALETVGAKNYDDTTCNFMAEGILFTTFGLYQDKAAKVAKLAGIATENLSYDTFKSTTDTFYGELDNSEDTQLQLFADLHKALSEIVKTSEKVNDVNTTKEATELLINLESVLNREENLDYELAEAVADYISDFIETNLGTEDWTDSGVHTDLMLQHPDMGKKAKQSYSPAADGQGDWKNDNAEELETNGWSNVSGDETFPSLNNPYVPKSASFELKAGDKNTDSDELGTTQGNTWPGLSNPYVPKAVTVKVKE
jgi:hypothetical protein